MNAFTVMKALAPPMAALAMAFLSSNAIAETTEERQACIGDAFRVCWAAIPNRDQVFHCLLDNRSRLNPACRVVMLAGTATSIIFGLASLRLFISSTYS